MIKIVFFGSDQYSEVVLKALQKIPETEIVKIVKDKNDFEGLKNLKERPALTRRGRPDVGIIASFGSLIPQNIINLPQKGLLNLHPSLLPKYRGPTPVPTAILNGEKETGLTIIKVDEQIDHGPIVSQFKEIIKPEDTSESLLNRLFTMGSEVLVTILPSFLEDRIEIKKQNHLEAAFTKKLTREDGKIDWQKPINYQERFIRAMFPWPGAWSEVQLSLPKKNDRSKSVTQKRLKILKAYIIKDGKLILDLVQLEGKKPVTWKQFQEGYPEAEIIKRQ